MKRDFEHYLNTMIMDLVDMFNEDELFNLDEKDYDKLTRTKIKVYEEGEHIG